MAKMSKGKFKADLHPRGRGGKFIATADRVKEKKYKDPKLQKFAGLSPDKRARLLKLVARKSKTANSQEAPQVTKAPKGKRKATVKITIPTAAELATMKVKELEELAAKIGATPPLKYRNRKVSWTEAIEAHRASTAGKGKKKKTTTDEKPSDVKPPKKTKGTKKQVPDKRPYTTDNLKKLKVSELEAIAKELGAKTPTKYKTRKDPWITEILAKQEGADSSTSEVKKTPKTPETKKKETKATKADKGTPKSIEPTSGEDVDYGKLIAVGDAYSKKFKLGEKPSNANLEAASADEDKAHAALKDVVMGKTKVTPEERKRIEDDYFEAANRHIEERRRVADEHKNFEDLRNEIIKVNNTDVVRTKEWVNSLDYRNLDDDEIDTIRELSTQLHKLTGGKTEHLETVFRDEKERRAYARELHGDINVGDESYIINGKRVGTRLNPTTYYHEVGHHVEYAHPELREAADAWRGSRATGRRRRDQYGEEYLPDNFIHHYVGRTYKDYFGNYEGQPTEVISMGIQHFTNAKDMKKLYEGDKEHFNFMVGVLLHKGKVREKDEDLYDDLDR